MSLAVLFERCKTTDEVIVNLPENELVSVCFVEPVTPAKLHKVARALFQMAEHFEKARVALRTRRKHVPRE